MRYQKSVCILLCVCMLTGCSTPYVFGDKAAVSDEMKHLDTFGEAENMQYEVPISTPNIFVNQVGYQPDGRKIAVFRGENLDKKFRIVDQATSKTVYTGVLEEKGLNEETGEYISYGIFSEFKKEGTYYVEAEKIGRSYCFEIRKNLYDTLFETAYSSLMTASEDFSMEQWCYVAANLLTSYELYPKIYSAGNGIMENDNGIPGVLEVLKTQIDAIMKAQDAKTGTVRGAENVTLQIAGILACFAKAYEPYDVSYASDCLKSAEKAWIYAEKNKEKTEEDDTYFAAAQLYRMTGKNIYHMVIQKYLSEKHTEYGKEDMSLYGDVAYLFTQKSVDVDLCKKLMADRMAEGENIAETTHEHKYMICLDDGKTNQQEMLHEMVKLSTIDYVITNHEYATVMENHLHYLLGRNPEGLSYIAGVGDRYTESRQENILADPKKTADFIFMMTAIINHEADGQQ